MLSLVSRPIGLASFRRRYNVFKHLEVREKLWRTRFWTAYAFIANVLLCI